MSTTELHIDQLAINTIRTLSMDAVQAANSGHPGTPMALAPIAYSLWNYVLRYNPQEPAWPNRDRFVLSCGHASMLLYSTLHLAGVQQLDASGKHTGELAVPLEHIKNFRQLHSRCPGHPEHYETTGVETTTGPLGQGCGNSVGMAMASRWLGAHFNKPGFELFNFDVYALCSDGDMMEGVTNEAASIAGHLGLSNLCWIYDDNKITIEGDTELAFTEDVAQRFEGLGWHVIKVPDANDLELLADAYASFKRTEDRPTLIIVRSHIAWGSPNKVDTHGAHGAPLGEEEIKLTKAVYGWPDEKFYVPSEVLAHFKQNLGARGRDLYSEWRGQLQDYAKKYPELAEQWRVMERGELPANWDKDLPVFPTDAKGLATRISSGKVLNAVAKGVPWFIGGSADLAPSTMTLMTFDGAGDFEPNNHGGRNMHFGIREHGMCAAVNGMALTYVRPFGSTFLVFMDYCRPSIRLAALTHMPAVYIFTHDSIGVGEDGPTHQPIEHLAAARAIPNLMVVRPGDANEVTECWRMVMKSHKNPAVFALTRQNLPTLDRTKYAAASNAAKGAYILGDAPDGKPKVILMATGSEVSLCVDAYEQLKKEGIAARVVSMPCWEWFEMQSADYQASVLPESVTARVAVETGVRQGWDRYLGRHGRFLGMEHFGASAPGNVLFKEFGFTVDNVVAHAKAALEGK